ncbi:hypothetical protein BGZ95_002282 [Linnemannia exigua]|uniref:Uncharacterized protein n=1 Tax=Linnemannia exigua TaxID=604196 RepID=A0AAD4DIJ2_9FUNG|nr:hypothetical protein BGZ95_002282 [Linnemannia exigua]
MRTSTFLLAAMAVTLSTFTTTPVTAMNAACDECSTTNGKAVSAQCNTTLTDKNREFTNGDIACLKSLVANNAWIQSCVKPNACTADDVQFVIGSYNMVIQVFDATGSLPDSSSPSSSGNGAGAGSNSSGSNGSGSGAGASTSAGNGFASSDKVVTFGALAVLAAVGLLL